MFMNGFVGEVHQRNTNKSKNNSCIYVFIILGFVAAGAAIIIAALSLVKLESMRKVIFVMKNGQFVAIKLS